MIQPNPTERGIVTGRMFNQLLESVASNEPRTMVSRTTRGSFPRRVESVSSTMQFSGVAYVRGVKFAGLDSDSSKPWVKVYVAAGTAVEDLGPPPDPFPDEVEYYEKAQTAGDIHVTRFG